MERMQETRVAWSKPHKSPSWNRSHGLQICSHLSNRSSCSRRGSILVNRFLKDGLFQMYDTTRIFVRGVFARPKRSL